MADDPAPPESVQLVTYEERLWSGSYQRWTVVVRGSLVDWMIRQHETIARQQGEKTVTDVSILWSQAITDDEAQRWEAHEQC